MNTQDKSFYFKQTEALKLALQSIEDGETGHAAQILREALAEQPAQQEPVAFGALAKRRVFDYIRGAYDLGYNDARNARAIPGDGAPGYKGRDVEADHGSALLHALEAITSPPVRKPWVGLTEQERNDLEDYCEMIIGKAAFEAIEAKLREKNA